MGVDTALFAARRDFDAAKERHDAAVGEDKALERAFKKEVAEFGEHAEMLLRLYKKRGHLIRADEEGGLSGPPRSPHGVWGSAFWFVDDPSAAAQVATYVDVDLEEPPRIEGGVWNRFLTLRDLKLRAEQKVRDAAAAMEAVGGVLSKREGDEAALRRATEGREEALRRCVAALEGVGLDLEMLMRLKQVRHHVWDLTPLLGPSRS